MARALWLAFGDAGGTQCSARGLIMPLQAQAVMPRECGASSPSGMGQARRVNTGSPACAGDDAEGPAAALAPAMRLNTGPAITAASALRATRATARPHLPVLPAPAGSGLRSARPRAD